MQMGMRRALILTHAPKRNWPSFIMTMGLWFSGILFPNRRQIEQSMQFGNPLSIIQNKCMDQKFLGITQKLGASSRDSRSHTDLLVMVYYRNSNFGQIEKIPKFTEPSKKHTRQALESPSTSHFWHVWIEDL